MTFHRTSSRAERNHRRRNPRLRVLAKVAIALGISALVAGVVSPAGATFPGDNGRISFSSDRSGRLQIYTMSPHGGRLEQLTNAPGNSIFSDWTPDGEWILFDSDRPTGGCDEDGCNVDIFIMSAEGEHVRRLTRGPSFDGDPAVSPDGKSIAFGSDRDGDPEIFTMRLDGTHLEQLTHNDVGDFTPDWSPDGKHIAFSSDRAGGEGSSAVYTMRSDGSRVRRVTPLRLNGGVADWSPDGELIAFVSNAAAPGTSKIYVVEPDGEDLERLTNPSEEESDFFPSWSPNGRKLTFSHFAEDNIDIYVIRADGSDPLRLTRDPAFDIAPDWGND
ncbi:hypothetical protein BH24ACT26_BH24ACT26_22510 [soil metagenome]